MPVRNCSNALRVSDREGGRRRERKVALVMMLTLVTMVGEILVGIWSGSLALLGDGIHMATHASALGIAALAYYLARKHEGSPSFSFGTGKFSTLAGYTNALLLGFVSIGMVFEGALRLYHPEAIDFSASLPVAIIGLLVNLLSVVLLTDGESHGHSHGHAHGAPKSLPVPAPPGSAASGAAPATIPLLQTGQLLEIAPAPRALREVGHEHNHGVDCDHDDDHGHAHGGGGHSDHNHAAALAHVTTDLFTSVLAIGALLAARYYGWGFLDPLSGIVGGLVILKWSYGLLHATGGELLDSGPGVATELLVLAELEKLGAKVVDLHVWPLGSGRTACIVTVLSEQPLELEAYRRALERFAFCHLTIEVERASGIVAA